MRRMAVVTAVLVAAACSAGDITSPRSLLPGGASLSATVTHIEDKVPMGSFAAFIPCAGELAVATNPELHVVAKTVVSASGRASVAGHYQPLRNWDGIGSVTGDVYQAVGVSRTMFHVDVTDGLPQTFTEINNFRWIGPGPGNNLQVHTTLHITVNANGTITANVVNATAECF